MCMALETHPSDICVKAVFAYCCKLHVVGCVTGVGQGMSVLYVGNYKIGSGHHQR